MEKINKKSIKPSRAKQLQEPVVSSTSSDTPDSNAASTAPNPLRMVLRSKIAKKTMERSPKKKATAVVKKTTKRVRVHSSATAANESAAATSAPRRSARMAARMAARLAARKEELVENSSTSNVRENAKVAPDQPSKRAPRKSSVKKVAKKSAIKKDSKKTPAASSSAVARRDNQRVSKASRSRAKPSAASKKKKRVTATQANTSARDEANVTDANAAQLQNVQVANEAHAAPVEAEERVITPPPQDEWERAEVIEVVELVGDGVDDSAWLPDLLSSDHEDVEVIEQLPSPAEEPLEVVFSGIPETPAKRWIHAETEAGKKLIRFYSGVYGEGNAPEATNVEEAIECIELVKKIEIVYRQDQHVNDVVDGLKQMGLPYCPLFFYNNIVWKWIMEQRMFVKLRNDEMQEVCRRYMIDGKGRTMRVLNIKKLFKRANISKFKTAAFRQTVQFFGEDEDEDEDETETKVPLPDAKTEQEAFECIMFMLHQEFKQNSGRAAIEFLNLCSVYPNFTWMMLYSTLRPVITLQDKFKNWQFRQSGNTFSYFGKKLYQASLRDARVKVGLPPKAAHEEESDDGPVDQRDHRQERDKIARKLGRFRAKHNLPSNNLSNRVLP